MPNSRSAVAFMRRNGLAPTPPVPGPRLATGQLKTRTLPLDARRLTPALMLDTNGAPPTDRGRTDIWPPPQEIKDGPTSQ
jgi:hypothetical protein